jgi:alkylation response protein AidB-like acyl-CoA dehydrogenase
MPTATTTSATDLVAPVAETIRKYADQMEREREMPAPLFEALADAGLFRIRCPPSSGRAAGEGRRRCA